MIRPELKEGEVYCPKCDGYRENIPCSKFNHYYIPSTRCEHCKGTGKLDWIENIVGKKDNRLTPKEIMESCNRIISNYTVTILFKESS